MSKLLVVFFEIKPVLRVSQPDRMVGWLLVLAADGSIKSIKIQIGLIRDCHNDLLTDPPISIQESLPRRPQLADRIT